MNENNHFVLSYNDFMTATHSATIKSGILTVYIKNKHF